MRLHSAMLRTAAWLVPGEQRAEWLAEWNAELWYVRRSCSRQATRFCLGAFRDAFWLRRNRAPDAPRVPWFESPARCLGTLGLLAAACLLLALRYYPHGILLPLHGSLLAMLYLAAMALPALPAITSLQLGEVPSNRRAWCWVFFAAKIVLLLPIVFFGALDLASMTGLKIFAGPQHFILIGNAAAFRWALIDQRRRCPECLRTLTRPAHIGRISDTFLEWCGTEFMCVKGHGFLHVPDIPTVSFRTQTWMQLDRSWRGLFL